MPFDQPEIVVTGLRHSGTTSMLRLLAGAGKDPGPEADLKVISPEQGGEWRPLFDRVVAFSEAFGRSWEPDREWWWRRSPDAPQRFDPDDPVWAPTFRALQGTYPQVVKCPEMTMEWTWVRPSLVIVMQRDLTSWVESMRARSGLADALARRIGAPAALGYAHRELSTQVLAMAQAMNPRTVMLEWPRAATDPDYVYRAIARHVPLNPARFTEAHRALMKPTPPGQVATRLSGA